MRTYAFLLLLLSISLAVAQPKARAETAVEKVLRDIKIKPRTGSYTIHPDPWEVQGLKEVDEYLRDRYAELHEAKLIKLWTHQVEGMIYRISYEDEQWFYKVGVWENQQNHIRQVLMFRQLDKKHMHHH